MYQYRDLKELDVGDVLECQETTSWRTKGNLYVVTGTKENPTYTNDDGSEGVYLLADSTIWKLLKTKNGSDVKDGDIVITIKNVGSLKVNDIFTALNYRYTHNDYKNLTIDIKKPYSIKDTRYVYEDDHGWHKSNFKVISSSKILDLSGVFNETI